MRSAVIVAMLSWGLGAAHQCTHDDQLAASRQAAMKRWQEESEHVARRNAARRLQNQDAIDEELMPEPELLEVGPVDASHAVMARSLNTGASSSPGWHPMRLRVEMNATSTASPERVAFVRDRVLPTVVQRIGSMLQVRDFDGPLFFNRRCTSRWSDGRCANVDTSPVKCSSSSVSIPIDSTWIGASTYYTTSSGSAQTIPAGGAGLNNADTVLFTAVTDVGCGSAQAYALTCQRDSIDRPIGGIIVFCTSRLPETANPSAIDLENWIGTGIHEVFHVLGFSSGSWPLFRNPDLPDLPPRTPRNPVFSTSARSDYVVSMSCGTTTSVAANTTIGYFAERGSQKCNPLTDIRNDGDPSRCTHRLVTPRAQEAARKLFGCDDLEGPELESQDTTSCVIQSSHWERRAFFSMDLMVPVDTHTETVSAATLAVLEDSGWYKANYSAADLLRPVVTWGVGAGCDFARDQPCLIAGVSPTVGATQKRRTRNGDSLGPLTPHYCAATGDSCTVDRQAVGLCSISTYTQAITPSFMQYFTSDNRKGGQQQTDFCPLVSAYSNRLCIDETQNWVNNVQSQGYILSHDKYGHTYGKSSLCLDTTLRSADYNSGTGPAGACMRTGCTQDSQTNAPGFLIYVPSLEDPTNPALDLVGRCTSASQLLTFPDWTGSVKCLDPVAVCGDYAPVQVEFGRPSATPSPSTGASATSSPSLSSTPSNTPSNPPSPSVSPTNTPTPSGTPTTTASRSATPTPSTTTTATATTTPSRSASPTPTPSPSPSMLPVCERITCSGHGTCIPPPAPAQAFRCECEDGWRGSVCSVRVADSSLCDDAICGEGGICTRTGSNNATSCFCASGLVRSADGASCAAPDTTQGPRCDNGIVDGSESGVDCGGATCAACGTGLKCRSSSDCESSDIICLPAVGGSVATCQPRRREPGVYVQAAVEATGAVPEALWTSPTTRAQMEAILLGQIAGAQGVTISFLGTAPSSSRQRERALQQAARLVAEFEVQFATGSVGASAEAAVQAVVQPVAGGLGSPLLNSLEQQVPALAGRIDSLAVRSAPLAASVSTQQDRSAEEVSPPSPSPGPEPGPSSLVIGLVIAGVIVAIIVAGLVMRAKCRKAPSTADKAGPGDALSSRSGTGPAARYAVAV